MVKNSTKAIISWLLSDLACCVVGLGFEREDSFGIYIKIDQHINDSIPINTTSVAYEGESSSAKYEYPENDIEISKKTQWIDIKDQAFQVWMKIAGFPTFRKLYGKIEEPLASNKKFMIVFENSNDSFVF